MTQQRTPVNPADTSAGTSQMHKAGGIPLRIFAICLTSVVVAVHYTNYGPLIPTLINDRLLCIYRQEHWPIATANDRC